LSYIVEAVSSKMVMARGKNVPTFSAKMSDGTWYKFGFDDPGLSKGMEVDFLFESTAYGPQVKKGTLAILSGSASPSTSTSAAPPRSGVSGGRVFPIPALHGDRSIIRQNALAHAVKTVEQVYHVSDPAAAGDVLKDSKKFAEMAIEVARLYESYSAGDYERLVSEGKIEGGA